VWQIQVPGIRYATGCTTCCYWLNEARSRTTAVLENLTWWRHMSFNFRHCWSNEAYIYKGFKTINPTYWNNNNYIFIKKFVFKKSSKDFEVLILENRIKLLKKLKSEITVFVSTYFVEIFTNSKTVNNMNSFRPRLQTRNTLIFLNTHY
jgi:hypothetical protein